MILEINNSSKNFRNQNGGDPQNQTSEDPRNQTCEDTRNQTTQSSKSNMRGSSSGSKLRGSTKSNGRGSSKSTSENPWNQNSEDRSNDPGSFWFPMTPWIVAWEISNLHYYNFDTSCILTQIEVMSRLISPCIAELMRRIAVAQSEQESNHSRVYSWMSSRHHKAIKQSIAQYSFFPDTFVHTWRASLTWTSLLSDMQRVAQLSHHVGW